MKFSQGIFAFLMGYFIYSMIEIINRGYTHWTMALTGGAVLTILYAINCRRTMTLIKSCFIGTFIITSIEFAVGIFVNIIMDSLNSLSFGGEPPKDEYMTEKPIKKGSGLFIRGAKKRIAISTVAFIALYGIITFSPIANMFATETEAITARFALLCFMAVFNGFNIRTEHINLFNGIGKNKLFSAIAIGIFVMTFALCNFAENLIKVTALDFKHWVVVVILAFMVIPIDLIRKIIEKKRENK